MTPSGALVARLQMVEGIARTVGRYKLPDRVVGVSQAELIMLHHSELFVWDGQMADAVASSSMTLPSPLTLSATLAPSPHGVFFFSTPRQMNGVPVPVGGIGWSLMGEHLLIIVYTPSVTENGLRLGPFHGQATFFTAIGVDVDITSIETTTDWRELTTDAHFDLVVGRKSVLRFLLAGWLWMQQTIVRTERVIADRASRKLCERVNLPTVVNVVQLRRAQSGVAFIRTP